MLETRPTKKYMSFIFIWPLNGIDFIRRFGECWWCRVVDDIGAAIDVTAIRGFFAGGDRLPCVAGFSAL
jgi:hypothetical protein